MTLGSVYKERFVSPFEKESKEAAEKVLEDIRACHPKQSGWVEIEGYVEELSNGKWRAIRVHEKAF